MYSGTTMYHLRHFDAWFGAHQKIDRAARKHLRKAWGPGPLPFPTGQQILKFEGMDGPDGIKRKTPGQDELWHYYDPYDDNDTKIIKILETHYRLLAAALKEGNQTRAAFEAAWLAHGIVDGLTPAHHYPYEEELVKLRGGKGIDSRNSPKDKIIMPGDTIPERVGNNWKMWGDKGLLATHFAFEWGIAVMIVPMRLRLGVPTPEELASFESRGLGAVFRDYARQIADLELYDTFYKSGWTPRLAKQCRRQLIPLIVNMVTLAWYGAMAESQKK